MKLSPQRVAATWLTSSVESEAIYPNQIDHGYEEPVSGETNVMQELVGDLRHEQGGARAKSARAAVTPVRQRTQYSCMATSMSMCLRALGYDCNEDEVNRVMGAAPMKGAAWEQALAAAQHYGCRATLTTPSTVRQLKAWTDAGKPVMIAWNPEGREWSHASVVFDVDDDLNVYVADPNIPDPDETVRVVSKSDFYKKWFEKWPNYLVRRPALCIEREITEDGKQVMASKTASQRVLRASESRVVEAWLGRGKRAGVGN